MPTPGFGREFSRQVYNDLVSVEDADHTVRVESQLTSFLESASKVCRAHNMQSRFGVSLLHKHYLCQQGEHMVEYSERIQGRDALVTRPSVKDPDQEGAKPVVWKILKGEFFPLEYSTDVLACKLLSEEEVPVSFLNGFRELVDRSPIAPFIGLSIVSREFYNRAQQEESAVEYSDGQERKSIVILTNPKVLGGNTIETAWSFEQAADAERDCLKSCRKQCWSTEGGHDKQHTPHHH
jgi:hypothetical protein